jgi:hypothetical protein
MHNEPLDHEPLDSEPRSSSDALDQRLIRALENTPKLEIPADFAARIAAQLPARPYAPASASIPVTHYGRSAMLIGIVLMLAAMLPLAAHSGSHPTLQLVMEWTLFAQFVALTIWFTAYRRSAS